MRCLPPVIKQVKKHIKDDMLNIIDCPPGTSCPFIAAVEGVDVAMLVTEPTPFGLHDLKLAVETMREIGHPFGVVINRSTSEENIVTEYWKAEGIPLLLQIPYKREAAEAYSAGKTILEAMPEMKPKFIQLVEDLRALAESEAKNEEVA